MNRLLLARARAARNSPYRSSPTSAPCTNRLLLVLAAAAVLAMPARAHEYAAGDLIVGHPWSRPTAAGMSTGVAYLSITNNGVGEDALVSATTPAATRVEFHQTQLADGLARMRQLREVVIAAGHTVKVEPNGIHIMLVGLRAPLENGKRVPLELTFRVAGTVHVEVTIESRDAPVAAENAMTEAMGTVTVVARRPSSLPFTIPATVEGITGDTVARTINATDSEDALKYFPSLIVRKRYTGDFDHAVLASRASGTGNSARSLVYVDGILLSNLLGNGASFTPRWGLVTPEEIERVDVLYGPFSAAYPGNSVGAVVDYVTRMPQEFEARASLGTFSEDFNVHNTHDTYSGWQASASAGGARDSTSFWANFSRLDSDGHPLSFANKLLTAGTPGANGTPVTGALAGRDPRNQDWWLLGATSAIHTVQDHAKFKIAQEIGKRVRVAYTLGVWANDISRASDTWLRNAAGDPVWSGLVNIDGRAFNIGTTEMSPARGRLTHLMHGLSIRGTGLGAWDLEAAGSRYDYERDVARSPNVVSANGTLGLPGRIVDQSGTGWSTLALRARRHASGLEGHTLEFGLQDERYELSTRVNAAADWSDGPAGTSISSFAGITRLTSFYAQDHWRFASDWQTTFGARLERWHAGDGQISVGEIAGEIKPLYFAARTDTHISPKAALAWEAGPGLTFKASAGRAVRMPTVSELFQGSVAADEIINNDPSLAPERSWTTELSALVTLDHGDLRSTLFFEDTRDALYSQRDVVNGGTINTIQNLGNIRTSGVELAAHARALEMLELSASLTWARSRIRENDNFPASVGAWQPRVPEWRANALLTLRPRNHLSLTLGARYGGRQYNTLDNSDPHGTSYTGTSRFLVADARVRYELGERWSVSAGVDNLGNERYWAFHPYTRRSYSAELAARLSD